MPSKPVKRGRGRPVGSRAVPREVRAAGILEAAGEVFARRGYHSASMDDIAEQAGVTKPVVYSCFESKGQLYVAYIERAGQDLLERMRGAADPSLDARERLHAGVLQFLRFVDERRDGWRILYAEAGARGGPLAGELADMRERVARMIARLLDQSASTHRPAPEPLLDALGHAFVGAGESLANWWLAHPELPAEQIADWLMELGRASVDQALPTAPAG